MQSDACFIGRYGLDKAQPFLSVVVFVTKEVLAYENLNFRADRPGREDHRQDQDGAGEEDDLERRSPGAADVAQVKARRRHHQQIQPGAQEGGGMEHELARDVDRDRPVVRARDRDRDQRHGQRVGQAARVVKRGVDALEQKRVGIEVEVVGEQPAEPEAEEFDPPAAVRVGVAEDVLQQHQPGNRKQQVGEAGQQRRRAAEAAGA